MSIKPSHVKDLREKTGAGMMDCKKALVETKGDVEKAQEWLRKKGLSGVSKKASRLANEGLVQSYVHAGGRIGVLLEVNSETDFVSRNENFKSFVHDIAMHIAASNPHYIQESEIPEEDVKKEEEILKEQGLNEGKKEEFVNKIVQGRLSKWKKEICLLSQSFVKNPDLSIQDYLNEIIIKIGENIIIRRFIRYELGEGIEKKKENFLEEVQAQIKK